MYKKVLQSKIESLKKVLVVDDEQLSRDILSKALSRYLGCDIYAASNGTDALSYLKYGNYDILLLDLGMPGMSGIDLIRKINLLKIDVSILIVTGNAGKQDIKMLKELGINRIIYKPYKISVILEMIADSILEKEQINSFS